MQLVIYKSHIKTARSHHIYKYIDTKINKLVQTQTNNTNTDIQFYPRVVNKTNISFTGNELTLLNKGLKYKLSQKR